MKVGTQTSREIKKRKKKNVIPKLKKKTRTTKWTFLQHNGPLLPPPYKSLPERIRFLYDGNTILLSQNAEEVASFYAKILDNKYLQNETFNTNFFNDWREVMTEEERETITDFTRCNFRHIRNYFRQERKLAASNEQVKKENNQLKEHYGFCCIDGLGTETETFRIEPGIFLGRGEHPKTGRVKRRIEPEDIIINCSEDSIVPEPPTGHQWKAIVHDQSGMWLAKWTDKVLNRDKYIKLKAGSNDKQKYQKAKELGEAIAAIRDKYFEDMDSEYAEIRQRAVALYLIDELGFRTGNEKNEDEANTVGCCSLRVQHIQLQEGKIAIFDFLGKSSIHYYTQVYMDEKVFKNLQSFQENKVANDLLFDLLTPLELNNYLNERLPGLTIKVFRTWNASYIFEKFLELFTDPESCDDEKVRCYKSANLAVAILLNHRTTSEKQFEERKEKMIKVKKDIHEIVTRLKKSDDVKQNEPKIRTLLQDLKSLLFKNKEILPGTSKSNYLDPRITTAWCAKQRIPIESVFTKTERKRFAWAVDIYGLTIQKKRREDLRDFLI